jgi:hypothetical protein
MGSAVANSKHEHGSYTVLENLLCLFHFNDEIFYGIPHIYPNSAVLRYCSCSFGMKDNFGAMHLALDYLLYPYLQIILKLKVTFCWMCDLEREHKKCMQTFTVKPFSKCSLAGQIRR